MTVLDHHVRHRERGGVGATRLTDQHLVETTAPRSQDQPMKPDVHPVDDQERHHESSRGSGAGAGTAAVTGA